MTTVDPPHGETPTFVVGLGASAGGLEALQQFVAALAPGGPLAFVIIQHLSPDFESHMEELLSRHTTLRVQRAEHELWVQRDHIYVMPPKVEMGIKGRRLQLSPRPPGYRNWQPINHFFTSLAEDDGQHAIAVVLSGAGNDGAAGVREVHRRGGLVLAQSEESAMFSGMPSSAVATGVVQGVDGPAELASMTLRHATGGEGLATASHTTAAYAATSVVTPSALSAGLPRLAERGRAAAELQTSAFDPRGLPQLVDPQLLRTYDRLLDRYLPSSILISAAAQIMHVFAGAERFLRHRGGRATHHLLDLIDDSLRAPVDRGLQQVLRSRDVVTISGLAWPPPEADVGSGAGADGALAVTIEPLLDPTGTVDQLLVRFHDAATASEQRLDIASLPHPALEESGPSYEDLRTAYDSAEVGIARLDATGRWSQVNPRFCDIVGYNRDELHGMSFHQLTDPEDLAGDVADFDSLIRGEVDAYQRESRYHHRDGHIVWVWLTVSRQPHKEGQTAGGLAVIQDITLRKQTELAQQEARRMAESENRAKTHFVTNMSHELRSPMTAVLGFADMLAEEIKVPEQLEKVQTLKRNGEYLVRLLDEILDLSAIESRSFAGDAEPCDLIFLIDELELLMQGHAEQLHTDLHFHFPTLLPKTIYSSTTKVRQILMNLVADAVKSSAHAVVQVTIRYQQQAVPDEAELGWIELELAEAAMEGEGTHRLQLIPWLQAGPEIADQLAERAARLHATARVVGSLGGTLEVAGEPTGGAVLLARWPVGEAADLDLVQRTTGRAQAESSRQENRPHRILGKILVADDRRDIWQVTKYFLQRWGAQVAVAEDGQQAVQAVQEAAAGGEPFDLVLLDMQMPVMDGWEAVRALRAAGFSLPIIALTADAMEAGRKRCLAAGCSDYMTKPIDVNLLIQTVAKHLAAQAR